MSIRESFFLIEKIDQRDRYHLVEKKGVLILDH